LCISCDIFLDYNKLPEPINIISVDWQQLASYSVLSNFGAPCYNIITQFAPLVGKRVSEIMKFLILQDLTAIKDIHVMGHSLGSHVAGFTCKHFDKYNMGKCSRVTGNNYLVAILLKSQLILVNHITKVHNRSILLFYFILRT